MEAITTKATHVATTKRGIRIWLEGHYLADAGFTKGSKYDRVFNEDGGELVLNPNGKFKVSGKAKPIIDIGGKAVPFADAGQKLDIIVLEGRIILKVAAS